MPTLQTSLAFFSVAVLLALAPGPDNLFVLMQSAAGGRRAGFAVIAGLMLGGLVTLRPDHDAYVLKVLGALREGDSAVVVHALSAEQKRQAERILADAGSETTSTL